MRLPSAPFGPSICLSVRPCLPSLSLSFSLSLCHSFGPRRAIAPARTLFRSDKSISLDFHFYASIARVCAIVRGAQRMTTKGYRCTSNYDRCVPFRFDVSGFTALHHVRVVPLTGFRRLSVTFPREKDNSKKYFHAVVSHRVLFYPSTARDV